MMRDGQDFAYVARALARRAVARGSAIAWFRVVQVVKHRVRGKAFTLWTIVPNAATVR